MIGMEDIPMIPRQKVCSLSELFPDLYKDKEQKKEWELAPIIDSAYFKYEDNRIAILPKVELM